MGKQTLKKDMKQKKQVKYYDYKLSNNIYKLLEVDPFLAAKKIKEYLNIFYRDYPMYCTYCSTLITIGEFDEAYETLINMEEDYAKDKGYHEDCSESQNNYVVQEMKLCRLRYLTNAYKYEEALRFMRKNEKDLDKVRIGNLNLVDFFCNHRTGNVDLDRRKQKNYMMRQILEYQKKDFIDKFNKELGKGDTSFYTDFDLEKVYDSMYDHLQTGEALHKSFVTDTYYFRYDNCGMVNGTPTDYFVAVVFRGTSKILEMHPAKPINDLIYEDLNYLNKNNKSKVKRVSQIDKFNQKYKNMI